MVLVVVVVVVVRSGVLAVVDCVAKCKVER